MKKLVLLMIIGIMLSISLLVGVSYALWSNTHVQEGQGIVESGCFSTDFSEVNSISLSNVYPISDSKGMSATPYQFTITNTCTVDAKYEVNFEVLAGSTLSSNYVKLAIDNKKDILSNYESKTPTIEGALSSSNIASGWLKADESITYDLRLWMDEATTLVQGEGKSLSGKVVVVSVGDKPETAVEFVESLFANNLNTMNNDDPDGNVRYMGADPNNYVWFNDELWRIIGVFDVDNGKGQIEKRVKLIRHESIGNYSWDSSESSINSGYGINEWSQADLMHLLNSGAYWNRTSGTCYNGVNNAIVDCDFSNIGLTNESKEFIENVVWNTGTILFDAENSYSLTLAESFYFGERSNNNGFVCEYGIYCNDTVTRLTTWIGQVGLMYPSDYGYATSGGYASRNTCLKTPLYNWNNEEYVDCYKSDWLYDLSFSQWLLTSVPLLPHAQCSFTLGENGSVFGYNNAAIHAVKPVVYLKSSINIIGGSGTAQDPYTLN